MSLYSPKNRFRGQIVFTEAREGIGSVVSFTSNSIEELKSLLSSYAPGHVTISENLSTYPSFNWQKVEDYNI